MPAPQAISFPSGNPRRILLIRPSALGDVVRSVPVLVALRERFPDARIDWLVQDSFADAVAHHPALSPGGVVPFARKRFGKWWNPAAAADLTAWLDHLHGSQYDLVIDAQGLLRSALFAGLTRAPVRIGYENVREVGAGAALAYTHTVHAPGHWHAVDRMMALVAAFGRGASTTPPDMGLYAPPADVQAIDADTRFAAPYAVLAPTTRWPAKQWPPERYIDLARDLLASRGGGGRVERIVLVGARGEESQCRALLDWAGSDPSLKAADTTSAQRVINLIGGTTLGSLMAIIRRCAILVGSDSAAVHIAVGFNRPLVALYGPTDVSRVGPYQREQDVLQHLLPGEPLQHKLPEPGRTQMARISTAEVVGACAERLG